MAHFEVTLYTDQKATVVVEIDEVPIDYGERDRALRDAALAKLDESGGAEWETTDGFMAAIALAPDEV
jgi:hypothetical protein